MFLQVFTIIVLLTSFSRTQLLPITSVKKCQCKGNEVVNGDICESYSPILNAFANKNSGQMFTKDISNNTKLSIVEPLLSCPSEFVKERKKEFSVVSLEGELLQYGFPESDRYCVENYLTKEGNVTQEVEFCVAKYNIRLCCKDNEYIDASEQCRVLRSEKMKSVIRKWLTNFYYETKMINCGKDSIGHSKQFFNTSISDINLHFQQLDHMTNKSFCVGMIGDENEMYPTVSFCNSTANPSENIVLIPTCCSKNAAFDMDLKKCVPHSGFEFPNNIVWPDSNARIIDHGIYCDDDLQSILELDPSFHYYFDHNGTLYEKSGLLNLSTSNYCLGAVIYNNQTVHSGMACSPADKSLPCAWRWDINRVCLSISSIFLVATLVVYLGVPELRKKIGGLCLIAELVALLASQVTLLVLQSNQSIGYTSKGCLTAGILEIIFALASFFWLNVMCYDVWSAFRIVRPLEKEFNTRLFIKYSVYGWGIPFLIGIFALIMELTDSKLKPNFIPETRCFFSNESPAELIWLYMYSFILLLMLINVVFFVHVAMNLIQNQKEQKKHFRGTEGATTGNQTKGNVENLKLYGKLFVIMGLPWLLELVTVFASDEISCYIWFLDLPNALRGVLIFIIFVCKKTTFDLIVATWCPSMKSKVTDSSSSEPSRKTSTISLSNWIPSIKSRKISKMSTNSAGQMNLGVLQEEG